MLIIWRTLTPVLCIKLLEEIYDEFPAHDYPLSKIYHIIDTDKSVQKELLVIKSNRMRTQYLSDMKMANVFKGKGDYHKAIKLYQEIQIKYPEDTSAALRIAEIESIYETELSAYNHLLEEADSLYLSKNFEESKKLYSLARSANANCEICQSRLMKIAYYLTADQNRATDWKALEVEADHNFEIGNYEMAHYQYLWLHKHDKLNKDVEHKLTEVFQILAGELEEKQRFSNAKLLLERANIEFEKENYKEAQNLFHIFTNRYSEFEELKRTGKK